MEAAILWEEISEKQLSVTGPKQLFCFSNIYS